MSAASILMRRTFLFALPMRGEGGSQRREGSMAHKTKIYPGIDYGFRPETYWGASDPLSLILSHVKGTSSGR